MFKSPSLIPIIGLGDILVRLLKKRKRPEEEAKSNGEPNSDYTIIMPLYNKEGVIRDVLESWRDYKDRLLVVDDLSQDNGSRIVEEMGFNLLRCERNGRKVGAVWEGLKQVGTKYSLIVDADVVPDKSSEKTLDQIVGEIDRDGIEGGTCEIISNVNQEGLHYLLVLQWLDHKNGMRFGKRFHGTGKKKRVLVSGGFGIYRTDVLKEITQYQMNRERSSFVGEDLERNLEIIARGGQIGFYGGFRVVAEAPKNWKEFIKQRVRWTEGELIYFSKYYRALTKGKIFDRLANEVRFNTVFNKYGNPVKVATIPLLAYYSAIDPEPLTFFAGTSVAISGFIFMNCLPHREFFKNIHYITTYPLYKMAEMVISLGAYRVYLQKDAWV